MSEKKLILKNFSALSLMQAGVLLLPMLTLPYLVRVLGIEKFGLVAFAQAIMVLLMVVGDFGINLYAPGHIAAIRQDYDEVKKEFWHLSVIRLVAVVFTMMICAMLIIFVPRLAQESRLFWGSTFHILSVLIFPIWFLQGMERMVMLAVINFIARAVGVGLVFFFIRDATDYWKVPYVMVGVPTVIFTFAFLYVVKVYNLGFPRINLIRLIKTVRDLTALFWSNVSVNLYTTLNPVVLGIVGGDVAVGYFVGAQKIVNAVIMLFHGQVTRVIYPNVSKRLKADRPAALRTLSHSFAAMMVISTIIAIIGFAFAPQIVGIVLGSGMQPVISVFRLMLVIMVLIAASNVFGIQTMLPFGMKKQFSIILTMAAVVNLSFTYILSQRYAQMGATLGWFAAETFVVGAMFYVIRSKAIRYLTGLFKLKYIAYVSSFAGGTLLLMHIDLSLPAQIASSLILGAVLLWLYRVVDVRQMTFNI